MRRAGWCPSRCPKARTAPRAAARRPRRGGDRPAAARGGASRGTCVRDAGGAPVTGDTASWALGTVSGGQAGARRLRVRVDDLGAADPVVRVAGALLASGANAARAVAVTQVEAAPLDLVMVATPDPVGLGDLLTYALTMTNRGAVDAA